MIRLLVLLGVAFADLWLIGCGSPPPPSPSVDEVGRAITATSPELSRVEAARVPGRPDAFVAICDTEPHWWGHFRCVGYERGRVAWAAEVEGEEPDEQSIESIRALRVMGLESPLVEVFGTTHMGHGNCYLYELRGRTLRCVLSTFAVDQHQDGNLIRGGRLDVAYADLNGDGFADAVFTGIIDEYDGDKDDRGEKLSRSTPCRKVFLWNRAEGRFIEDRSARIGWELWANRP